MFGQRTRTLLPTSKKLLKPQLVTDVRERKLQRKEVQTRYYNQNVKELPSLIKGDVVRMKPQTSDGKQRWTKAQVEQQVDVRSYAVRTEDSRLFRRNWRHLRRSKEPSNSEQPTNQSQHRNRIRREQPRRPLNTVQKATRARITSNLSSPIG